MFFYQRHKRSQRYRKQWDGSRKVISDEYGYTVDMKTKTKGDLKAKRNQEWATLSKDSSSTIHVEGTSGGRRLLESLSESSWVRGIVSDRLAIIVPSSRTMCSCIGREFDLWDALIGLVFGAAFVFVTTDCVTFLPGPRGISWMSTIESFLLSVPLGWVLAILWAPSR